MPSIRFSAVLLAGLILAGEAAAQGPAPPPQPNTPAPPPLPPAGPAPRQEAQNVGRPLLYWAAGGVAIMTGVILLAQDNDGETSITTTTGTN
jgi:hypothetical protein